jgi:hypothetical protein
MVDPAALVQPQRYAVSEECRSRGHPAVPCFVYCFSFSTGYWYSTCCSFLCFIDIAWVIMCNRLYMHLVKRFHIALWLFLMRPNVLQYSHITNAQVVDLPTYSPHEKARHTHASCPSSVISNVRCDWSKDLAKLGRICDETRTFTRCTLPLL